MAIWMWKARARCFITLHARLSSVDGIACKVKAVQIEEKERIGYGFFLSLGKNNRTDSKLVLATKENKFESVPRLAITCSWMSAAGVRSSIRTAYRRLAEAGIKAFQELEFLV